MLQSLSLSLSFSVWKDKYVDLYKNNTLNGSELSLILQAHIVGSVNRGLAPPLLCEETDHGWWS